MLPQREHDLGCLLRTLVPLARVHSCAWGINHKGVEKHIAVLVIDLCKLIKSLGLENLKTIVEDLICIFQELSGRNCVINVHSDGRPSLDELLRLLEAAADAALDLLGPRAGLTPQQVSAAEADVHALVATVRGVDYGDIEVQAGAEQLVRQLVQLLTDLGVNTHIPKTDTPTALDAALELLRATLDGALEVWGPRHNLPAYTVSRLEADLAALEARIRDTEHGRLPLQQGLVAVVDAIFNLLRDCGVPVLRADGADLSEAVSALRTQLSTLRSVINSRRAEPAALPPPSRDPIVKLQSELLTLGGSSGPVTLFDVVYWMSEVTKEFTRLMG